MVLLSGTAAFADEFDDPSRPALLAEIEQLSAKQPEAAARATEAEALFDDEELERALAIYVELATELPWWAPAPQRQCELLVWLGRRSEAVQACRTAWTVRETSGIATSLAWALSATELTDRPTATDLAEADALLGKVLLADPTDGWAATVRCHVAETREDPRGLRACSQLLVTSAPEMASTWYYVMLLHVVNQRWRQAHRSLARAEELGLDPDDVESLREQLTELTPAHTAYLGWVQLLGMLWVLSWLGIVLVGMVLSTATARAAERLATSPIDQPATVAGVLRFAYRLVLGVTCVWYWLSMPVVLVAIGTAAAAFLFWFMVGELPAGFQWVVLGISLLVGGMLAARLLVTRTDKDEGIELGKDQHPQLWALLHEVAERVRTRPVDKVFLVPGTSIAVYEDSGLGRTMRGGRSTRCLVLGFGALIGLSVGQLRSILAHEYGHFSHGDTSGGAFALSVRRSLSDLVDTLEYTGTAVLYNPLAWLLLAFFKIFQLLSMGISRLQEVEADRIAIRLYGGEVFARTMEGFGRSATWFQMNLHGLLTQAVEERTRPPDVFRASPTGRFAVDPQDFEKAMTEAEQRSGTLWDSHPPTADRVRWARSLAVPASEGWNDQAPSPTLFADVAKVERELNDLVKRNLSDWIDHMARMPRC